MATTFPATNLFESADTERADQLGVGIGAILLGALIFFTEAVFRDAAVQNFAVDWQVLLRLLICGACGIYGIAYLPATLPFVVRFPGAWGLLLGIWALVTVPLAVHGTYAAAAAGALWCVLLFAPAVLLQLGHRRVVMVTLVALMAYLIGSWIMYYAVPSIGQTLEPLGNDEFAIRFGGLNHPNSLGRMAALSVALLFVAGTERWLRWRSLVVPILFALVTLLATDCRTALLAAIGASGVLMLRQLDRRSVPLVLCGLVAGVAAVGIGLVVTDKLHIDFEDTFSDMARSGNSDEIYTMNGRLDLWGHALKGIAASPIVGYGYGCARFIMIDGDPSTHHAHNVLLNVALGAGVPGGALVLIMLVALIVRMLVRPSAFPDMVVILVLIGGIADYVMLGPIPDSHTVMFLMALIWRQSED